MRVGLYSHPAPTLGRRPSTAAAARGTHTLTTSMGWTSAAIRISAARSDLLSVSVNQVMDMINQRIHVSLVAAHINTLVAVQVMPVVAERPVAGSIRLVNVQVGIAGVENLVGYILNSDMTVTSSKQSGKTPIGVVVCSYANGGGQAMALKSLGDYKWSTENVDISGLTNVGLLTAPRDVASCENSAKIRAHGDSSIHPAVWAAYNYSTEGTKVGDWCLPAAGIFISYYHNQNVINTGFIRAGGTTFTIATYAWSSSEDGSTWVWVSHFDHSSGLHNGYKPDSYEVRPVLEF